MKTYTRDEVIEIIKSFADDCEESDNLCCYHGRDLKGNKIWENTELSVWIEENIPLL